RAGQKEDTDDDSEASQQRDQHDRVVFDRLSHARPPVTDPGLWTGTRSARSGTKRGPSLPTPLGLRTLLRRWASTGPAPRGPPETDSQADCAGSQLERLSNKLEPSLTIAVRT